LVEKHRHCVICGMSVSEKKIPPVCSKKCAYEYNKKVRKQSMTRWVMFIPIILIMVLFLVMTFF